MKFKRLKNKKTNEITIAVENDNKWVPLEMLLQYAEEKGYKSTLTKAEISDMVLLLSDWKKSVEEVNTLLKQYNECSVSDGEYEGGLMPFIPKSYRDFMIYEQHIINSTKGFYRTFLPQKLAEIEEIERTTGKVPEMLKPKALWYEKPIYYMGNHLSFLPDNSEVVWPSYSKVMDFELEMGMLITKPLFNATNEEAKEAIGGFVVFNDCSARDKQIPEMESGFGPVKAKNFASLVSEVIVTPDEIWPYIDEIKARAYINDILVLENNISGAYHSFEKAAAYASLGEKIYPGEFIATGTISGCSGIETGNLLKNGDVLRMEIDRIGSLTTRIKTIA